jgi:hypothetical protein
MSTFVDSSALVKLYADEVDSEVVRRLRPMIVSCLARVEVPAAIWRKHRTGDLTEAHARILCAEFEADYFGDDRGDARFVVVGVVPAVLDTAAELVADRKLRAYDGIQLASARAAREVDPSCGTFACTDRALRKAAVSEGFVVVP